MFVTCAIPEVSFNSWWKREHIGKPDIAKALKLGTTPGVVGGLRRKQLRHHMIYHYHLKSCRTRNNSLDLLVESPHQSLEDFNRQVNTWHRQRHTKDHPVASRPKVLATLCQAGQVVNQEVTGSTFDTFPIFNSNSMRQRACACASKPGLQAYAQYSEAAPARALACDSNAYPGPSKGTKLLKL